MNYLIFRGVSTESLDGAYISLMPSHKKASMRSAEYYVKGRDGALHVDEGYANFDLTVRLVLVNGSATARQIVNAWADGTGKLISSDNPSLAYMASVKSEVRWKRVLGNKRGQGENGYFDTAEITFNCQPFMYEAVDSVIDLTESGVLVNPGSADAYPLICVEGSGTVEFDFAGYPITINNMETGVPVYIDCENGYVYNPSGATTMTGEIPKLDLGSNAITFTQGVTKMTVTPHWRWV